MPGAEAGAGELEATVVVVVGATRLPAEEDMEEEEEAMVVVGTLAVEADTLVVDTPLVAAVGTLAAGVGRTILDMVVATVAKGAVEATKNVKPTSKACFFRSQQPTMTPS